MADTYAFSVAPIYFVFRVWWTIYIFVKMNEGIFGILFKYVRKLLSGFLLNQILTYQGWFLVASLWLIFHLWKWHPSPSTILCQTFRPVRFTSSGIRASAIDIGYVVVFIVVNFVYFRWLFKFVLSLLLCSYFICTLFVLFCSRCFRFVFYSSLSFSYCILMWLPIRILFVPVKLFQAIRILFVPVKLFQPIRIQFG